MKIPSHLTQYAVDIIEDESNGLTSFSLQSSTKEQWFDIYYYGELENGYITGVEPSFANIKIVAKSTNSKEEILLFDETEHGYNAMFCDSHSDEEKANRLLEKFNVPSSKIKLTIGYSIDYDSEKELYEFDEQGNVILLDGRKIAWQQLLCDGIDWLSIILIDETGNEQVIVDAELS